MQENSVLFSLTFKLQIKHISENLACRVGVMQTDFYFYDSIYVSLILAVVAVSYLILLLANSIKQP